MSHVCVLCSTPRTRTRVTSRRSQTHVSIFFYGFIHLESLYERHFVAPGQRGTSYFAGGGKVTCGATGRRGADPEGRRGGGTDGRRGEGARKIGGVTEGMGDYLPRFGSADGAQAHASRLSASRCAATLFGGNDHWPAPNFGGEGEKTRVMKSQRGRLRQELTRLSTEKFRAAHATPPRDSTFILHPHGLIITAAV